MRRVVVPELLDSDSGTPQEVEGSLADLRMFNRRFGGARAMIALLREIGEKRRLTNIDWLDVAGGAGDLVALTQQSLRRFAITVSPVIMDRAQSHLNGSHQNICGDALALPFRDNSFDVVSSSLFVHHLEREELVRFAREGLRVARHAFVINDLIRHPIHLALAVAGKPIYRSRITRHDAVASVRRAYTVDEIRRILGDPSTGATEISVRTFYLYRMGVIAWKAKLSTI
ncbi:MAG TPA: methyltransferase domain-containing protein [Candidatus Angelobacter sp.]|nr:methyltransferase domain-containing protein [Candidatus Angelobacter sp.]